MAAMGMLAASSAKAEPFTLANAFNSKDVFAGAGGLRARPRGPKVAIIGAGIAGLTAAYELSRVGYQCTVFEGREKAGGRCETLRQGSVVDELGKRQSCDFSEGQHLYFNSGAARIPFHHHGLLSYCKQFGIELETFTNENRAAYYYDAQALGSRPIRGVELDSDIRGYLAELLAKSVRQGDLSEDLSQDDAERLVNMLRSFGDLDRRYRFRGSNRGGYEDGFHLGYGPSSVRAPEELTALLDADFWGTQYNFAHQANQTPTLLQPVGGMSKIAQAFARKLGPLIRYVHPVTGVYNQNNGVQVIIEAPRGYAWAIEADYAIIAVSAPVAARMSSNLSNRHQNALAGLRYIRAAKLAFEAPRFWEEQDQIYGGISWTSDDITQLWYPAHGYHQESGIVGGAYIWDQGPGTRFANLSVPERIELGKQQGSRIHPDFAQLVRNGISRSWWKTDWVRGGWRQGPADPVLREPDGRIYFAGEHINALAGWQEGAIISAHEAVGMIHAREGFQARQAT